jgi:hypothetical protein
VYLLVALSVPAFAQQNSAADGGAQPYANQPPFSSAELSRFMRDWPDAVAWLKQHNRENGNLQNPGDLRSMFAGADFQAYMKSKGWALDRFGYVAVETAICLASLDSGSQLTQANSQMESAIKQIESDPNYSADQKKQMIQMMQGVKSQSTQFLKDVPQSELDLVRPRQEALKTMFDQTN